MSHGISRHADAQRILCAPVVSGVCSAVLPCSCIDRKFSKSWSMESCMEALLLFQACGSVRESTLHGPMGMRSWQPRAYFGDPCSESEVSIIGELLNLSHFLKFWFERSAFLKPECCYWSIVQTWIWITDRLLLQSTFMITSNRPSR